MSKFNFETITGAEALGITAGDHLTVSSGAAYAATVLYGAAGDITLILGAQSVDFGGGLAALSQAGGVTFMDGTVLYVGDGSANSKDFGFQSTTSGAFFGGGGDDFVRVGSGHFVVQLNAGDDQVQTSGAGDDTIYGGQGDDTISLGSSPGPQGHSFAQGNMGNDGIFRFRSKVADTLLGGKGNDTISGNGGAADFLNGNLGNDVINGQGQLFGEDGNDTIGAGIDGPSTVSGGAGNDSLYSQGTATLGAVTVLFGDDGDDIIFAGSAAHDELHGGAGNDTLSTASEGSDLLDGGPGDDFFFTSQLNKALGDDTFSGGDEVDTFEGGFGRDVIFGGAGSDIFFLGSGQSDLKTGRLERVMDWSSEDRIVPVNVSIPLQSYVETSAPDYVTAVSMAKAAPASGMFVVQVGGDLIVFADSLVIPDDPHAPLGSVVSDAIMLVGRSLTDIDASNFTLPPI